MSRLIPYSRSLPFGRFFEDSFLRAFTGTDEFPALSFRVDVKDKGDAYELEAELPGAAQDQVEVAVDDGVLTISANMNVEKREEKKDYIYSERRVGSFKRCFNVENIREDEITAAMKNGILTVMLPKNAENKPSRRKIDIAVN